MAAGRTRLFVKTYDYPGWRDRTGNWGKWTAPWRRSRAARECAAFRWLARHGFPTPGEYACFEWRTLGFVRRASLVTTAVAGTPADRWLAAADEPERRRLAARIGRFVRDLHERGFRDRNLDLRNLIVDGDRITKIDSPRHRVVAVGNPDDARAEADWQRLLPQFDADLRALVRPPARRDERADEAGGEGAVDRED
ncbi:MAG: lipopolysaccharide kinase InaA family protein [Planctomycetota bacterium]